MEGTTATECREAVRAAAAHLAHLRAVLFQVPCAELAALAGELDELARQSDATAVAMVVEVDTRGVVAQSTAANTPDWLMTHMRGLAPGEATRLARVATACRDPRNRRLAEAVLDGRVGTRNAAVALTEIDKLRPRLAAGAEEQVVGWFTQVAADGFPKHLRELRSRILAMHGHEDAFQREEDLLKRGCSLSKAVHDDGMSDYHLRLDPEAAAVLDAAIDPLSAPQPSDEGGPDLRSPGQRWAEALLEVCRRAAAAGGDAPTTTKSQVIVTMDLDSLRAGLGHRTTLTGELLAPETVRKLACDASVVPMVLGGDGGVLDVGRLRRLVTPRLLAALWVRDAGCTFPGCTRPAPWCHAHHVRHWVNGGPTDLANLALLCARHHTVVHQRGLTATVSSAGVAWHT
ncbi:HNH endonuclease signature motif containing protein [Oryzihumus leptocrescens]|uniref:HNH endonuclease n=1 Tax=Oryzihumus leptocrescens TaxID=297536 RepID=A0A542Z949_9MICO|nr:HNH endonuclease signature motif containing protein [Oryzihumus leptocrescens]TQL56866.1 HNH endonuclease [Oryzihumus leptocrescens]